MFGVRADKTYTYTDPRFLNRLVLFFSEKDCGLSACLRPDVQELIDAAENARPFSFGIFSEATKEERLRAIRTAQRVVQHISELCERHNVIPFWNLEFDYGLRQFEYPKIEYRGYNFGSSIYDEPRKTFVDPIHFARESKWYGITFSKAQGEESVRRVKLAVAGFVRNGYRVTSIGAKLKPRTVTRGTCEDRGDYEEYDASLYASNGKIEIYGKVPKDIDIEKIKEMGSQELTEQPELPPGLEQRLLASR